MKRTAALACFTIMAVSAAGGSLMPPGPPASTMKTLDEVEARTPIDAEDIPLTISQPGSYYFTENITLHTTATNGIVISSRDVEIDLNGFTFKGPGKEASTSGDGIRCSSGTTGTIVIRNGNIRDWGNDGIDAIVVATAKIEDINASYNGTYGISMSNGIIENCSFDDNDVSGVIVFGGAVKNCQFRDSPFGIVTGGFAGGIITNNEFYNHTSFGIRVNSGNFLVENNNVLGPGSGTGIFVGEGKSLVIRNTVTNKNTAYNLHTSCTAGPIVVLNGGVMANDHPWANFSD